MQRIATDDTTPPAGKSAVAATRSPGEAIWRPRARSPGAYTPAFACPKPPNRLSGRSRPQPFMSSRPRWHAIHNVHPIILIIVIATYSQISCFYSH